MRRLLLIAFAVVALPAQGTDLASIYAAAIDNDPQLGAARAAYRARAEIVPQARAGLLPNVAAGGSTSDNRRAFPGTPFPDDNFNEHVWQVQLRQPLFDGAAFFNWRQAQAIRAQAGFDLANTEQALIVRVAQAYLDILRVQAQLESATAEEAAVRRQLEQVQQRFEVGLVAITDVLESKAAFDNTRVRRIQAEGDLDIFFENLRTLTGTAYDAIDPFSTELPILNPSPLDEDEWASRAVETNYTVLAAQQALVAAERDVRVRQSAHLPTVTGVASYNEFVTGGQAFLGSLNQRTYSVELSMPIYQGGSAQSRVRESRARVDEARENLENRRRTVQRDTRNLYRSVATDVLRVQARARSIESSQAALEATETGYEVGTRNIVDVLQAQQRLYQTQFDHAAARYDYVLNMMRLRQAAGVLAFEDIQQLNGFMDPAHAIRPVGDIGGSDPQDAAPAAGTAGSTAPAAAPAGAAGAAPAP